MLTQKVEQLYRAVRRLFQRGGTGSALLLLVAGPTAAQPAPDSSWPHYGNDPGGMRYSPLTQIDRGNVSRLQVAWTYRTGALEVKTDLNRRAAFEATPVLVDGKLFLSTPYSHVIALDPKSGVKLWEYDPRLDLSHSYSVVTSRGVSAWRDASRSPGQPCVLRIFLGTLDARLVALDGLSGERCRDFGADGQVDLTHDVNLRNVGDYQVTSAPSIAGDLVITGSSIGDNRAVNVESGIVRAFDVRSGQLRWTWDPIPWATETRPRTGAANAWAPLSVDQERDLVFIPTGSASPDYYGGIRKGDNKWANSVVALRASTGEFVWGFQVVHHDLWDYDVPSQPVLFTGKEGVPAVAITTKMGRIFVLNRLTGTSLFPTEEVPVPKSDIPGEQAWPTQPSGISLLPERALTPDDAWGLTPEARQWCADRIRASRSEGIFTPPSLQGTIQFPGAGGGVNWGSSAFDPQRHVLIMNLNRLATWTKLIPRDKIASSVKADRDNRFVGEYAPQTGTPYGMYRESFRRPRGLPCTNPPWGTIAAVDLFSGQKVWDVPLGGIAGEPTGSPNSGGAIVTAGGLVFTAAAEADNFLRAFDVETGKEIWKTELRAGGQATPMTYSINGKQYLLIAAGGHGNPGSKQGDYVIAFALR
jgi:quinoprotein glucose dehydrogenase